MYTRILSILLFTGLLLAGCRSTDTVEYVDLLPPTEAELGRVKKEPGADLIETGMTRPEAVVGYARTLIGTPYLYASTDPSKGFDCSGFITHIFNHFDIKVPRSSVDFTYEGKEIAEVQARAGDIILFTGTDSTVRQVGHMGIILSNSDNKIEFIHSSSGKAKGVVITPLERYYRSRFVKVIRVFPQSFFN